MKTHQVQKARKAQGDCEACGEAINAGDAYKFIQPRMGGKRKRHSTCPSWRPSELTSSDKLSTIYGAQEQIEDLGAGPPEEIAQALRDAAEQVRDASEGYEESASNMEEHFPGSSQVDEIREKGETAEAFADALESAADEVEALDPDEHDDEEALQEEALSLAQDAASQCEL